MIRKESEIHFEITKNKENTNNIRNTENIVNNKNKNVNISSTNIQSKVTNKVKRKKLLQLWEIIGWKTFMIQLIQPITTPSL